MIPGVTSDRQPWEIAIATVGADPTRHPAAKEDHGGPAKIY